jgi:parallel beta-helix repeat protein
MQTRAKWQYTVGALALVWGLGVGARPAQANPACGATLGPGGAFALTGPLTCGTAPTLTVISATLDLKGNTVTCTDNTNDGIVLQGTKAKLLNGTVTGCYDGVELQGTGSHQVTNVTSTGNANEGFDEQSGSNANKLSSNTASNNGSLVLNHDLSCPFCCDYPTGGIGFFLDGNANILRSNTATGNYDDGFELEGNNNNLAGDKAIDNDPEEIVIQCNDNVSVYSTTTDAGEDGFDVDGDGNLLSGVIATGNDDEGVSLCGSNNRVTGSTASNNESHGMALWCGTKNTLSSNTANGNDGDGYSVRYSDGNSLTGNSADDNEDDGFFVNSDNNILSKNKATNNVYGSGFELGYYASGNLLIGSNALSNGNDGVEIDYGSTKNIISKTKALGNSDYDLEDENSSCDSNSWIASTFGSANQSCIH